MSLPIATIGSVGIYQRGAALVYAAGLAVDADGANGQNGKLPAYAPKGSGIPHLDALGNAGEPGDWFGLATTTGKPSGQPLEQGANDPCPGAFVSTTALGDPSLPDGNPRRYVDAATVPYVSVPPELLHLGVKKGDLALVTYRGASSPAIVADVGPHGKIGEGSIALASALGLPPSPINGGTDRPLQWTIWPGTASTPAWPRALDEIAATVATLAAALPA